MADDDRSLIERIDALVAEEHALHDQHLGQGLTEADRERLHQVEVGLDQCWDLLRQRRALRRAGRDPAAAEVRPEGTVERYQQ
jgi:Protein of unknown function (DUF2630)